MKDSQLIECKTLQGNTKMVPLEKFIFKPSGYAVVFNDHKVLLLKTKSTGKYWFPGGGTHLGERLEEGLKREVREETGIDVEIIRLLKFKELFFYYEPLDEAYHALSFFYLCKPLSITLAADDEVDQEDESEKPRWVELDTLRVTDMQTGAEDILTLTK
jgi:8-oxo-dGTP pyrophosphatase MutT (NUDIX family)